MILLFLRIASKEWLSPFKRHGTFHIYNMRMFWLKIVNKYGCKILNLSFSSFFRSSRKRTSSPTGRRPAVCPGLLWEEWRRWRSCRARSPSSMAPSTRSTWRWETLNLSPWPVKVGVYLLHRCLEGEGDLEGDVICMSTLQRHLRKDLIRDRHINTTELH